MNKTHNHSKTGKYFWGPHVWSTIHSMAAGYTTDKAESFIQFITGQIKVLPCKTCSLHAEQILKEIPIKKFLKSRDQLFLWSYLFHDIVNRTKDNPTRSPPFAQIRAFYYTMIEGCKNCSV